MPALANGASKTNAQTADAQPGRIRQWLNKAGLVKYFDGFNKMTESQFASLMMQDYPKHGVSDMADKQKLFRLLKTVNAQENIAAPPTAANVAPAEKTPNVATRATAPADDLEPLLVSPADEDLLSEAVGLAGDVLATPGGLLDVHGGDDADDDLLGDVDIDPARVDGEADVDANDPKTKPFVPSPSLSNKSRSSPVDRLSELSGRFAAVQGETAVAAAAKAAAEQPRIRVVVRKRPLNKKETATDQEDIVTMDRDASGDPEGTGLSAGQLTLWEPRQKVDLTQYTEKHEFLFDDVYPEDVDNDEIYRTTVHPLIGTIFNRCKVTCFAYGQTGSGKTYTMSPLPTRAAGEILAELAQPYNEGLVLWVSFFEIYGGKVYDLLNGRKKLVIREDARQQMCVVGLQEFEVDNVELVERLIEHGTAARCTGSTGANSESSRSHAILQLSLKRRDDDAADVAKMPPSVARQIKAKENANHALIHGKFSFIDLAGSERGADTDQNDRQTRLEGAEINKSLLALKECIRALDMGSNHVPFRGSKLTEVLRDSFLGDSRTVMIANISPATGSCEHTLNTLRYAYRVKELRGEGAGLKRNACVTGGAGKLAPDGVTPIARGASLNATDLAASTAQAAGDGSDGGSGADAKRRGRARPQSAAPAASLARTSSLTLAASERTATLAAPKEEKTATDPRTQAFDPRVHAKNRADAAERKAAANERRRQAAQERRTRAEAEKAAKVAAKMARMAGEDAEAAAAEVLRRSGNFGTLEPRSTEGTPQRTRPTTAPPARTTPVKSAATTPPPPASASTRVKAPFAAVTEASASAVAAAKATAAAEGRGPPVDMSEMVRAHDDLINVILEEEEEVIAAHRGQIEETMELVKTEMALLADVDKPGSAIDQYVDRLSRVLAQKAESIAKLRERVATFQTHLREEEVLSRTVGLH